MRSAIADLSVCAPCVDDQIVAVSAVTSAVADVIADTATIWSSTQGAHTLRSAIADLIHRPPENVHVIWTEGSGCYGHNGSDDAAADAAMLSSVVRRPVKV